MASRHPLFGPAGDMLRATRTHRRASPRDTVFELRIERRDVPVMAGVALSLLLHALALFLSPRLDLNAPAGRKDAGPLTVNLAPAPRRAEVQPAMSPPTLAARTPDRAESTNRTPRPAPRSSPPRQPMQPVQPLAETIPAQPSDDDLFTRLQARRAARQTFEQAEQAVAAAQSNASDEDRQGLLNAQRNLQALMASGGNQGQTGGVFEIRSIGYRHAEFYFRGWSTGFRRNWAQVVEVEQGSEATIQAAIIKKIIAIIREHESGDFSWESHRLGQVVRLSARPEDNAGLEEFMMREFFPEMARGER